VRCRAKAAQARLKRNVAVDQPKLRVMQRPSLRFLFECVVVTMILILATTIVFSIRRSQGPDRKGDRSESRPGEQRRPGEQSQPGTLGVALNAYTRQAKSGSIIHIEWDPSAHAVRHSPYGILYIYDGGTPSQLRLDRRVLDSGSSQYTPASDEVAFHLILPGGRPEGEFLLVLLGSHGAARTRRESDRYAASPNRPLRSATQ
jgi:hypothetical protein